MTLPGELKTGFRQHTKLLGYIVPDQAIHESGIYGQKQVIL
jgi:hypothetical protein